MASEVLRRRSDGSEFWALMSALPITYEGKEALLSWTYDITERKRTEEELARQQLTHLRHVLENVAQGIVKWGVDRRLVISNKRYQEVLRSSRPFGRERPALERRDIVCCGAW